MQSMRPRLRRLAVIVLLISVFALCVAWNELPDHKFHIYFFDVGQGDSVFIKTPENYEILIDGGPKNDVLTGLSNAMPFLDRSLDLVVVTHPHADHIAGLVEVLKKYEVGKVMLTGVVYENGFYDEFLRIIEAKKIPVIFADQHKDFTFGTTFIDTLYPFEKVLGASIENVNNSSIVMRVTYKDKTILLTGDAEKEVEYLLTESGVNLSAKILKVGHHGSKTSSQMDFLARVRPEIAVIQCGFDNTFGHPNQETLDNLERAGVQQILRNDLDGMIELSF